MKNSSPTLCFPDKEKSCFACCPPIRPAGYEHIQYRNIIKRLLRENTRTYPGSGGDIKPITGFSCWGLGYLGERYDLIGCLLHPAQNNGADLRYRVNYGEKCRRETCQPAKTFLKMGSDERQFWLCLTDGMDPFEYSSRRINPLFNLMGWGGKVLGTIFADGPDRVISKDGFMRVYPFFKTSFNPKGHAYLLSQMIGRDGTEILKSVPFRHRFEKFSEKITVLLRRLSGPQSGSTYTHQLNLDHHFLDFLRLTAGISQIDEPDARKLKEILDHEIHDFGVMAT